MRDLLREGAISSNTFVWTDKFGNSWKRLQETCIEIDVADQETILPKQNSYLAKILQPGERVLAIGRLHWIIYKDAMIMAVISVLLIMIFVIRTNGNWKRSDVDVIIILAFSALILTLCLAIKSWFNGWITEIMVTNRRVIYNRGFIRRHTVEMNMEKIESVTVTQSILGRLLDYGTIHVRGTGVGIEDLRGIASPITVRNRIVAR
jgi:uncharacterized membrane protein YdbT with pleckstrin-like domain